MYLTPLRLVFFRLYLCTLGRIPYVREAIHWLAMDLLIRLRKSRNEPSSDFYSPRDLDL